MAEVHVNWLIHFEQFILLDNVWSNDCDFAILFLQIDNKYYSQKKGNGIPDQAFDADCEMFIKYNIC